jgi:mono/diheme cytochrome c family protein
MRALKHSSLTIGLFAALVVVLAGLFSAVHATTVRAQQGLDQEKLNRGARLYQANCAVCHGENGQGRIGATLNKNWPSIRPDLTVKNVIENGIPGTPMIAWSQANGGPLTTDEIDDLTYFILSWEAGGPPEVDLGPTPTRRPTLAPLPEVPGDPNVGAVLFAENCAVCHGSDGEGRIGATLAQNFPSIRPDLSVRATIMNGVPGSPMPAWSQTNGGPLTEAQIDDLTAFVLTLGKTGSPSTELTQTVLPPQSDSIWLMWVIALVLVIIVGAIVSNRNR